MIRLIDMLDRLRRRMGIPYTNLARYMGLSTFTLRGIIANGNLSHEQIRQWCEYLELHIQDYLPLYQYHERERLYHSLPGIPDAVRRLITDIKYFHKHIDCTSVHHSILPSILPHIYSLPHAIINIHTEIKNNEL
jgi:hypothetical protein